MDISIALKSAKDAESSPEQLDALFGQSVEVDRLLARHPKASEGLLESLSHSSDKTTRKYVVLNPNATKEVLVKLAPQFPGDFFKNPAFDLLVIEQPSLMFEIGGGVLKNILKRSDCPVSLLKWAVERGSEAERLAVTANPHVPQKLLIALASAGHGVAEAARSHVAFCEKPSPLIESETVDLEGFYFASRRERAADKRFLARLDRLSFPLPNPVDVAISSKSSDWLFRLAVARNKSTPMQILKSLTMDANRNVVLQAQKTISQQAKQALLVNELVDSYDGRVSLRTLAFEAMRQALMEEIPCPWHLHGTVWSNILLPLNQRLGTGNFSKCITVPLPSELLAGLAANSEVEVRRFVARNPGTSVNILEKLAMDKEIEVRWSVGLNPNTPIELQAELVNLLRKRCSNIDHFDQREVALDGTLKPDVQKTLLKAWRVSLWRAASGDERIGNYPSIDPILLNSMLSRFGLREYKYESIIEDEDSLEYDLSDNYATPVEVLRQLADSHESPSLVIDNLASNPSTPIDVLHRLAKDKYTFVRRRVAKNPGTTWDLLRQLKFDKSKHVSSAVRWGLIERRYLNAVLSQASDVQTNEDRLVEFSRNGYWTVRFAAAQNPSFPEQLRASTYSEISREVEAAIGLGFKRPHWSDVITQPNIELAGRDLENLAPEEYVPLMRSLNLMPDTDDEKAVFEAAASHELMVRVGACLHERISPGMLSILVEDSNILVRQLAIRRLARLKELKLVPKNNAMLSTPCPKCAGVVKEGVDSFACVGVNGEASCGFTFKKEYAERHFSVAEAEVLLRDHKIGPLPGFRSKAGFYFTSSMVMKLDEKSGAYKVVFDFGKDKKEEGEASEVDFSGQQSLGACPKCAAEVYERGSNYVCVNSVPTAKNPEASCDFKTGSNVLQQPISHEQVRKLLSTGRTDLLDGFLSSRTQRKFKAMLVWDAKAGKVNFEFESKARGR